MTMSGSPILQNGKMIGAVTHAPANNRMPGDGIAPIMCRRQQELSAAITHASATTGCLRIVRTGGIILSR